MELYSFHIQVTYGTQYLHLFSFPLTICLPLNVVRTNTSETMISLIFHCFLNYLKTFLIKFLSWISGVTLFLGLNMSVFVHNNFNKLTNENSKINSYLTGNIYPDIIDMFTIFYFLYQQINWLSRTWIKYQGYLLKISTNYTWP